MTLKSFEQNPINAAEAIHGGTEAEGMIKTDKRLTVAQLREVLNNPNLTAADDDEVFVLFHIHPDVPALGSTPTEIFDVSTAEDARDGKRFLVISTYSPTGLALLEGLDDK